MGLYRNRLTDVFDGVPGDKGLQLCGLFIGELSKFQSVTLFPGRSIRYFGREMIETDRFEGKPVNSEAVSVDDYVKERKFTCFTDCTGTVNGHPTFADIHDLSHFPARPGSEHCIGDIFYVKSPVPASIAWDVGGLFIHILTA